MTAVKWFIEQWLIIKSQLPPWLILGRVPESKVAELEQRNQMKNAMLNLNKIKL